MLERVTLLLLVTLLARGAASASAMDMHAGGSQLILSGFINRADYAKFLSALTPAVKTVVLTNSPGGARLTGQYIAHEIRRRGLATVASGRCFSSCANLFLGGTERKLANATSYLAFHSNYTDHSGNPSAAHMDELASFYAEMVPKLPSAIIQLFLAKRQNAFVAFFKSMTRNCEGTEPKRPGDCPTLPITALEVGILTSLEDVDVSGH